jgi:hypothetical protein
MNIRIRRYHSRTGAADRAAEKILAGQKQGARLMVRIRDGRVHLVWRSSALTRKGCLFRKLLRIRGPGSAWVNMSPAVKLVERTNSVLDGRTK